MASPTPPTIPTTSLDIILETPKPKEGSSIVQTTLFIVGLIFIFASILLITLLALDTFYIPYLSELSHFIAWIISPFVPLLFPLFLGVFMKTCAHKTWPNKKTWMFVTGSWMIQHLQRAVGDVFTLVGKGGMEGVCGLSECRGKWVEWLLVCWVVVGQIGGWKWDGGIVEGWIESVIKEDLTKQAALDAASLRDGEVPEGMDLEKAGMVEEVVFVSAEEEKRALMAGDELVADQEVLIVVEEDKA